MPATMNEPNGSTGQLMLYLAAVKRHAAQADRKTPPTANTSQ
jgi:ATP-dependent helicase/DNAse subunit B